MKIEHAVITSVDRHRQIMDQIIGWIIIATAAKPKTTIEVLIPD